MKRKFTPAIDLLLPSAAIIRQNILTFFIAMIIPSLLLTYASRSAETIQDISAPFFIAGIVLTLLCNAPLFYTQTKSSTGKDVPLTEAFTKGYHFFWRLFFLNILLGFLTFVGLLLLIIPGIIVLRRYFLSFYYLIDKDCSIKEAMRLSSAATKNNGSAIYGILGVLVSFYLVGSFGPLGAAASVILQVLYAVAPALRYQEFKNSRFKAADI